ncbi:GroES-like protein [Cadophora sp. DSE1049]|nr:GroES-like protein [Cadophora sp. DSE1049]
MAPSTPYPRIWIDDDNRPSFQTAQEPPKPSPGEVLVEVLYSGINPADIKHATLLGIKNTVAGYDFCGRVIQSEPNSIFQKGDVIAGYTPTNLKRPTKYGAHQSYLACPESMCFLVPENLPQSHAACVTVIAMTAADALFNLLKFPLPWEGQLPPKTAFLIWGASTGVGVSALQLAKAAGAEPIFVTASKARHSRLLELGATRCFEYSQPDVVEQIQAAVKEAGAGPVQYAFDAAGSYSVPSTADLTARCVTNTAAIVSVVLRKDKRFMMPLATTDRDVEILPPESQVAITISARKDDSDRAYRVLHWAIKQYGKEFTIPSVKVLGGDAQEFLEQLQIVADGGGQFGKVVVKHPFH